MLDKVIHYFASVHLSNILSKYKDVKMAKQKSTSLQHGLIAGVSEKQMNPKKIDFPCGSCGHAYLEIESLKDPQFEDHSIGCDKWFYFIYINLTGNEANVQPGLDLPYYCPTCQQTSAPISSSNVQQTSKGKGRGKGRSAKQATNTVSCENAAGTSQSNALLQKILIWGKVQEHANTKLTRIINSIKLHFVSFTSFTCSVVANMHWYKCTCIHL